MEALFQLLHGIHPMSDKLQVYLLEALKYREIPKKDFILKSGQICNKVYFIQKGLIRCFYEEHGKDISSWFMKEMDVIISVDSFYGQSKSYENMQALEDCELFYITYEELQYIYNNFLEFNYIGRVLTEKYYRQVWEYVYNTRMKQAPERYAYFINTFPELLQRLNLKDIATYLSITEQTLSRIRAMKTIS